MKKLCVALMLLMLTGTASFGAVSDDVYVRKDVFDAKMEAMFNMLRGDIKALSERMDGNFAKLSERIDGVNSSLSARIDGVNASLSERIDGLDKRIDGLDKRIDGLDKRIDGLDKRIDGLDKRIDDINTSLSAHIGVVNTSLSARIDDLRNGIYLWLVAIGLVVTVIATVIAWPKIQEKLKTFGKSTPSITLEDVERLIDRKNAELRQSLHL